ncbi:leucine-rich repeat and IQ domain-containing protein 1 [Brienomyrus brachyistius]|uniref:leucine-rich repeat and IQ domain-containing protein 1 n=1 Tax=Brienomyrus brachyistius TaxID=42636 RepID=UPI0020B1DC7A|nr:leucine-rich repeat and IQ domain-containing protein 1 [Brienomyrus brachyistius]
MDDLEDIISEELSRLSPANPETTISSEDTDDLSEEDGEAENPPYAAEIPETFLSRLQMDRRIIDAIENAPISGKHEGGSGFYSGVRAPEEVLRETGTWYHEDELQLRNRIISEVEEEESMTVRSNTLLVTASKETLTDFLDDDFYREAEEKFSFDLENLEKRLKEDSEKRIAEDKKMKEHILKERREEEDRRKHRYRIFEEELKEIEWETMPQDFRTKEENALLLDLHKQEAVIAELQKQLEEERQTVEAAQVKECRRAEELRNSAAVKIQASVRAFLVSKRTAAVLSQRRKERMKKHWRKEEIVRRHKEEQKFKEDEKRELRDKVKFWEREEKIRKETEEEGRRTSEKDECREREEIDGKQIEEERRGEREKEEEIRKQTEEQERKRERQTREKDKCIERGEIDGKQTEEKRRRDREKDESRESEEEIRKITEEEGKRTREKDECREEEEKTRKQTEEEGRRTREKDECGKREEIILKQTEDKERRVREKDECREREEKIGMQTEEEGRRVREKDECRVGEEKIRMQTEEEGRRVREKDECRVGEEKIRMQTEEERRRMREKDECREREEKIGMQTEEEGRRVREKDECRVGEEKIRMQTEEERRRMREKDKCGKKEEIIRKQTEEEEKRTREKDECREKEEKIRKQTEEEGRRMRRKEEEVDENQEEKLKIHVGEQTLWQEEGKRNEKWKENMKREEEIKRTMEEKQIGKEKETWTKDRFVAVDFLEPQTPKLEESKNKVYEEVQKQNQLERNPRMEKENVRHREIVNRFQENRTKQEIVKRTSQDPAWSINGRNRESSAPSGNKTETWKLPDNQQVRLLHPQCEEEQLYSSSMQRASLLSCVCSVDPCISPENSVNRGPEMTSLHTHGAAMNPSENQGPCGGPVDKSLHHPAPDELLSKDNVCLPDSTERKRVRWMRACTPWSKVTSRGLGGHQGEKKAAARRPPNDLPPIAVDVLLRAGTCSSLKQVTTVTLEDLPGCSLSTLSECVKLQALTLRRCGLVALEGISRCQDLRYIDVQENSIKFINCQDLVNLRVLLLNRNQLTSIHGLEGAGNLAVLELSYNSISRISGLETLTTLQRLLIDHNQLISTQGLRGVSTLLYLDCAHNHLSSLDGIDSCILLGTLRLQGNNISEPPRLSDHVLIRELHLDDNSLSSLDSVSACWLPLLRRISASRNSITQLPALSDFLSLRSLDVSYNCLSDLANVRLGLQGCPHLQDINVFKNPFQQEVDWRSALLETLPGLREIDGEQISTSPASATDGKCEVVPGSFTALCQFQAKQLEGEQGRLDRGRHQHSENLLQLAVGYRKAHERGEMSLTDGPEAGPHSDLRIQQEGAFFQEQKTLLQVKPPKLPGPTLVDSKDPECPFPPYDSQRPSEARDSVGMTVIQHQWHKYSHDNLNGTRDTGEHSLVCSGVRVDAERAATLIQASWRGYSLRQKLAVALASAQISEGEDDFDEVDVDEFAFDESALEEAWATPDPGGFPPPTVPLSDSAAWDQAWITPDLRSSPLPTISLPEQPLQPKPPGGHCAASLPRPRGAWQSSQDNAELDPPSRNMARRNETPVAFGDCTLSEKSEQILEEWGITDRYTAHLMLKRAQKMGRKEQQRQLPESDINGLSSVSCLPGVGRASRSSLWSDPAVRLALFRSKNRAAPLKAQKRSSPETGHHKDESSMVGWHCHHVGSIPWHGHPVPTESEHFLPEISFDVLNGGRVQLMAGSGSRDGPDQESLSGSSGTALSPRRKEHNPAGRPLLGHARRAVPSSAGAASAPSIRERISFRDNPVQLSGGWGGGKKRAGQGK